MINKYLFFILFLILVSKVSAQYQMGGNPLRVNTSLAGTKAGSRITGSFLQSFNGTYNEYERNLNFTYLSYDNFIKPIKSGIGVYYWNGQMKNKGINDFYNLKSTTIGICIAPKLSNASHFPSMTFSPSIGVEWIKYNYNYGAPNFEGIKKTKNQLAIRAGILLNSSYYFGGISLKYLSNNEYNLLFTSFHAGYIFQKSKSSKFVFSPTINIQYIDAFGVSGPEAPSENYLYIDALNINFKYDKLLFGTGIPNAMIGFQTKAMRAFISYNSALIKVNNFIDGRTSSPNFQASILFTPKTKKQE